jgi:hypothetical protein
VCARIPLHPWFLRAFPEGLVLYGYLRSADAFVHEPIFIRVSNLSKGTCFIDQTTSCDRGIYIRSTMADYCLQVPCCFQPTFGVVENANPTASSVNILQAQLPSMQQKHLLFDALFSLVMNLTDMFACLGSDYSNQTHTDLYNQLSCDDDFYTTYCPKGDKPRDPFDIELLVSFPRFVITFFHHSNPLVIPPGCQFLVGLLSLRMEREMSQRNKTHWSQWRLKHSFDVAWERSLHNVWVWRTQTLAAISLQQMNGTRTNTSHGYTSPTIDDSVAVERSDVVSNIEGCKADNQARALRPRTNPVKVAGAARVAGDEQPAARAPRTNLVKEAGVARVTGEENPSKRVPPPQKNQVDKKSASGVARKEKSSARESRSRNDQHLPTLMPKEFDSRTKVELYLSNLKEEMGLTKSTKLFYKSGSIYDLMPQQFSSPRKVKRYLKRLKAEMSSDNDQTQNK